MKKSALTVGAITLLTQGIGLADGTGSGSGNYLHIWPAQPSSTEPDVKDANGNIIIPGYDYYYCTKCRKGRSAALGSKPETADCTRP